jgi:hypothetical protein
MLINTREGSIAFLERVMPSEGIFFAAWKPNRTTTLVDRERHCFSIRELWELMWDHTQNVDTYFATATFNTEEGGRKTNNVKSLKSFRMDLDWGKDKKGKDKPWKSPKEAFSALTGFCEKIKIPTPGLVFSGQGFQCWWPLTQALTREEWEPKAVSLKSLALKHLGVLPGDSAVISDAARILRCPGTYNYKYKDVREVGLSDYFFDKGPYDIEEFKHIMPDNVVRLKDYKNESSQNGATPHTGESEAKLRAMLDTSPLAQRDDRQIWLETGMGLFETGWGEKAFEIWCDWSSASHKFDMDDQSRTWDSFSRPYSGAKITVGSLIIRARRNGWTEAPEPPEPPEQSRTEKLVEEYNKKYFVIQNYGGKCAVGYLEAKGRQNILNVQKKQDFFDAHENETVWLNGPKNVLMPFKAAKIWFGEKNRRQYNGVDLDPTGGEVLADSKLNLWSGFGVEARKGDWRLMKDHIGGILANGNEENRIYILKFACWVIQNPEKLPMVALVLRGEEGVGKGLFAQCLVRMFGIHALHITDPRHFIGPFNGHLLNCLFAYVDEAYYAGDKAAKGILNSRITEPRVMIEPKFWGAFEAVNRMSIILASNKEWVVPASHNARRYSVFDVCNKYSNANSTQEEIKAYFDPLRYEINNGGIEAMLYDLQRVNLGNWHPTRILHNAALASQKEASMDDKEQWLGDMIEEGTIPATHNKYKEHYAVDYVTLIDKVNEYNPKRRFNITKNELSSFLKGYGFVKCRSIDRKTRGYQFPELKILRETWSKRFGATYDDEQEEWKQLEC